MRAWSEISARMRENGFEANIGRLKVMWKNLRDQWKRNLSVKMPPEREWYFQRRINFLANTYEGGERAHCPRNVIDEDMQMQDGPDDSLYDVKADAFDYLENGYSGGGSLMDDDSPNFITEPKSEMTDTGTPKGPTLVTVLEENVDGPAMMRRRRDNALREAEGRVSPGQGLGPSMAKRPRVEPPGNADVVPGQAAKAMKARDDLATLAKALKAGKSLTGDPKHAQANKPVDKFDKYAAFVSTTLREMPELEAKRRMREMTMLLLEDIEFGD